MPALTRTQIKTLGEDTNETARYAVSIGRHICYDIVAVDAYDAERRATNLYLSQFGEKPDPRTVTARMIARTK